MIVNPFEEAHRFLGELLDLDVSNSVGHAPLINGGFLIVLLG
jgi:hypothetical protein